MLLAWAAGVGIPALTLALAGPRVPARSRRLRILPLASAVLNVLAALAYLARGVTAQDAAHVFAAGLAGELVVGSLVFGPGALSAVMTWVHHGAYLALALAALHAQCADVLALGLLEEVPSIVFDLGRVQGERYDAAFLGTFALFRVLWHATAVVFGQWDRLPPWLRAVAVAVLLLHTAWCQRLAARRLREGGGVGGRGERGGG